MILYQCDYLCSKGSLKFVVKTKDPSFKITGYSNKYPSLEFNETRFEVVIRGLDKETVGKLFLCGPVQFSEILS